MQRIMIVGFVFLATAVCGIGGADAATLTVGSSLFNPVEPAPTGAVIDTLVSPFSVPGKYAGTLTSRVIQGDGTNPYGGLTFEYVLASSSLSTNPLTAVTINGYATSLTDASYVAGNRAPTTVDRLTADVVGFRFVAPVFIPGFGLYGNGALSPGETSSRLIIQTNLSGYRTDTAQVIDGAVTTVAAFAPVPEPASVLLAGLGAILAIGYVRTRRRS